MKKNSAAFNLLGQATFLCLAVSLLGCAGGSDLSPRDSLEETPPAGCEPLTCGDEENPSMCVASTYDGNFFIPDQALVGWGQNPCLAKDNMQQAACKRSLAPEKLANINCIPDSSLGECPSKTSQCSDAAEKPTHCRYDEYSGQSLKGNRMVYGLGQNKCIAKDDLQRRACLYHLRPNAFGKMICDDDRTKGECPIKDIYCKADYRPFICTAKFLNNAKKDVELSSFGVNECMAKSMLMTQACALNLAPSLLQNISCRADN